MINENWVDEPTMQVVKRGPKERKAMQVNVTVHTELERLQDLYGIKTHSEMIAFLLAAHEMKELTALQHMTVLRQAKDLNQPKDRQLDILHELKKYREMGLKSYVNQSLEPKNK